MAGIGSYLERMRNSIPGMGGAPQQPQSAAGQMAGQLADAAGQGAGMPLRTADQRLGEQLQQGLSSPMFNVGLGILQGSQPGGGGALQGAVGGAMGWQQMQLAAQRNAALLAQSEAQLESLKLGNKEKRQLAQGREQFAALQRQNPGAAPADLLRLWAATSGDPDAVQAWAQVAQRDDQRQALAGYRQQLLDERQKYHKILADQGQARIDETQAYHKTLADQGQARLDKPAQPKGRALGTTRDKPLGGELYQREEMTADGWRPFGMPFKRSSNPLAELLGGGGDGQPVQAAPQGPAPTQGGQEAADRAQAMQLVQSNPGLRDVINQRLVQQYGRGL